MSNCKYCGKSAGWFKSQHEECWRQDVEKRMALKRKADETTLEMFNVATSAALSPEDGNIDLTLATLATNAGLPQSSVQEAIIAGFEEAAARIMADGLLTPEEEKSLTNFAQKHRLNSEVLDRNGTWTRLGKAAVLRDLAEGIVPDRVHLSGNIPFVLNGTEKIVWLFNSVRYLKPKVTRGEMYWTLADEGILAVSTENVLFSGMQSTVKIPLHQIVTLIEGKDGFTVGKASAQKPFVFITGDAAFSTDLVRGLAEIRSTQLASKPSRSQVSETDYATLITEDAWPKLPDFASENVPVSVQSESDNGTYNVVLSTLTCNCPDWTQRRAEFPQSDVRRVCKHISRQLIRKGLITDRVISALLVVGGCPPYNAMQKHKLGEDEIYFFHTEGYDWVDVIAEPKVGREYERFGYGIRKNGWSYGRSPKNAVQVKRLLRRWTAATRSGARDFV